MRFIGQITITRELFGDLPCRMAYLFMTDDDAVDGTFDADGGGNAVILQPRMVSAPVRPLREGPTLQTFLNTAPLRTSVAREYAVHLTARDEPEFTDQ
jgi:hypothetical protein